MCNVMTIDYFQPWVAAVNSTVTRLWCVCDVCLCRCM